MQGHLTYFCYTVIEQTIAKLYNLLDKTLCNQLIVRNIDYAKSTSANMLSAEIWSHQGNYEC